MEHQMQSIMHRKQAIVESDFHTESNLIQDPSVCLIMIEKKTFIRFRVRIDRCFTKFILLH